uniref:Uncharacterized protein n=1 Tax=Arundo donax TaxID=35708 RepID=A0A0A9E1Z6_ARUDO
MALLRCGSTTSSYLTTGEGMCNSVRVTACIGWSKFLYYSNRTVYITVVIWRDERTPFRIYIYR